jgi:hypothetical protein
MTGSEQDRYWYSEACTALGLSVSEGDVSEWNSEMNRPFRIGTWLDVTN